jgi:mannosyl-oligosaccharide alpha-1,2-mannosidase
MAINQTTRAGSGFSGISNVNIPGGGSFDNVQQSFLLAEVFKYSYLIQTDGEFRPFTGDNACSRLNRLFDNR